MIIKSSEIRSFCLIKFVQFGGKSIAIDFSSATRNYSRLRIAADPSTVVKLTCADFTANDGTTTAASGLTTTADDKGNAYFYGTWKANAAMAIAFNYSSTDYNNGRIVKLVIRICLPRLAARLLENFGVLSPIQV